MAYIFSLNAMRYMQKREMSRIYASRSMCETDVHNGYIKTVQIIIGVRAGVHACRVCTRFGKSIVFGACLSLREGRNSYCLKQDLTHLAPDQPLQNPLRREVTVSNDPSIQL